MEWDGVGWVDAALRSLACCTGFDCVVVEEDEMKLSVSRN